MEISATQPLGAAWRRMAELLFKPFNLARWLVLGFCAFLTQCSSARPMTVDLRGWGLGWTSAELYLWAVVSAGVSLLLTFVFVWIGSRGEFVFMEGVATGEAAVKKPWARWREAGVRLYRLRMALILLVLFPGLIVSLVLYSYAIETNSAEMQMLNTLWVYAFMAVGYFLGALLFVVKQFIQPVMYLRGGGWREALGVVRREILPAGFGPLALFVLMRLAVSIAAGAAALAAACATCSLAVWPYLGAVITLPLSVFLRAYTMYWLQQFGEGFRFFPEADTEPGPAVAFPEPGDVIPMR